MTLGQRLRARRKELGLTLADVGERLGCSASHVSDMEHGRRRVHATGTFATAYNLDPATLQAWRLADPDSLSRPELVGEVRRLRERLRVVECVLRDEAIGEGGEG